MRATDENLWIQLQHLCDQARKATGVDNLVMTVSFYDDQRDSDCRACVWSTRHPAASRDEAHAQIADVAEIMFHATSQFVAQTTGGAWSVVVRKPDGEEWVRGRMPSVASVKMPGAGTDNKEDGDG